MADIKVDTYKLNEYAQRLSRVNSRVVSLDRRLDALYWQVGLVGLWELQKADMLVGYSGRLLLCQHYLRQTASDFNAVEALLCKQDPAHFLPASSGSIYSPTALTPDGNPLPTEEHTAVSLWDVMQEELSDIPDDIQSAGEALTWIEQQYGQLPRWFTLGVDVLLPESLQEAYTITSGLLQGDLTLKEGWDVAKSVLSKNSKLAVICETLSYTFETGMQRNEEMEQEIYAQLAEGDILGAAFDGAEGFIDVVIGGSIEVLGDVGGGIVDDFIDNVPVVKGINMLTEYTTGMWGWNDGEGYSAGGLIGAATEKISEGVDIATDVITDATDYVTSAVTTGFKGGINFVKSWFD